MSIVVVAAGALSALGRGRQAVSAGEAGEPARTAITRDDELAGAGLARPFAARARLDATDEGTSDRAVEILVSALEDCAGELDAARPGWRASRVGLAIGTSSGGMRRAEVVFAALARGGRVDPSLVSGAQYSGPLLEAVARLGMAFAPATLVLAACASSTLSVGLGMRWLQEGACDLVLAGGFDALGVFVASGFESLKATTACLPPRPFRQGRDGMALGEGAAVLALALAENEPATEAFASTLRGYVRGFGASSDAVHLTAPDRTGSGLARAAQAALDEARSSVDLVSAHATATPFNDAAEARALGRVLGPPRPGVVAPVVHPFKAQVGHTLGAAGGLESLTCLDALARGIFPAAAGGGELDPDARVRLLERAESGAPESALKLSAAFGGANGALVLSRAHGPSRARASPAAGSTREAILSRAHHLATPPSVEVLAARLGVATERLQRVDRQSLLALGAVAALEDTVGSLRDAGIVVGTAIGPWETNARFAARLRDRGAQMVEPRRFPYTTPNAVAGECSVAFGLTGLSLAVGAGFHAGLEALATAATFVRAGDAERAVVVAVEEVGEAYAACHAQGSLPPLVSGAVALLVTRAPRDGAPGGWARVGAISLRIDGRVARASAPAEAGLALGPYGHLALLPLTAPTPPSFLESRYAPEGGGRATTHARVAFEVGSTAEGPAPR